MRSLNSKTMPLHQNKPIRFIVAFIGLFLLFYYFNILFFGITSPGGYYNPFLAEHLDYITGLRRVLLHCSAGILNWLGFSTKVSNYELLVVGHGIIRVVYSCLGLGVLSFFTAFVLAYPKPWKQKLIFLIAGCLIIEFLNIVRFVVLALYWNKQNSRIIDHHVIFNIFIYILISISLFFWVRTDTTVNKKNAKN